MAVTCDEGAELGLASVYVSVAGSRRSGGARLNLFARLGNIGQHVASVLCPNGTTGLVLTAAGFVADTWSVFAQATDPDVSLTGAIAAKPCCSSPAVRIRPDLAALFNGATGIASLIGSPPSPVTPLGQGAEGFGQDASIVGSSALELGPSARVLHWQVLPTAAAIATLVFVRQNAPSTTLTFAAAAAPALHSGTPFGSLVCDAITFTNIASGNVEYAL